MAVERPLEGDGDPEKCKNGLSAPEAMHKFYQRGRTEEQNSMKVKSKTCEETVKDQVIHGVEMGDKIGLCAPEAMLKINWGGVTVKNFEQKSSEGEKLVPNEGKARGYDEGSSTMDGLDGGTNVERSGSGRATLIK